MTWYIDTSAAMKLLVEQPESDALAATITAEQPDFVACYLLETELRRAVMRYEQLTLSDASELLDGISLHEVPPSLFREAGLMTGRQLRSLDALHLAAAVRLEADRLVTYDARMAQAARDAGVTVISPGSTELTAQTGPQPDPDS